VTPTEALAAAIERGRNGITVVWWPTPEIRDWLVEEVRSITPGEVVTVQTVTEAAAYPDYLVALVPDDEDNLIGALMTPRMRTQPLVVFLQRDGISAAQLPQRLQANAVDPDRLSEIDIDAERVRFCAEAGELPEQWLSRWAAGQIERNGVNYTRSYLAALLTGESANWGSADPTFSATGHP
jgi:hypothetical protein